MKPVIRVLFLAGMFFVFQNVSSDQLNIPVMDKIIVIDPGHGGRDTGVVGGRVPQAEKDVVLRMALDIQRLLQQKPGVKVFLTRKTDLSLNATERAIVANQKHARIFVSLHTSRLPVKNHPLKIYLNRFFKDPEISKRAEQQIRQEMPVIPWETAQNRYLPQSRHLRSLILAEWQKKYPSHLENTGPEQVPLSVLTGMACAAVLIELPFFDKQKEKEIKAEELQAAKIIAHTLAAYGMEK